MLNRLKTLRGAEDGFTLVELLVVIVILGILSAVVVFSVKGVTNTGGKSACQSTQSAVTTAAEAYKAQSGGYPATSAVLTGATGFMSITQISVTGTEPAMVFADKASSPNWTFTATFSAAASPVYTAATGC
jgi:general secretion pathway protein G